MRERSLPVAGRSRRFGDATVLRRHNFRGGRRGSVMILTIAVLVLMAILAISYIQVARLDRAGSRPGGNIDTVADAAREQIKATLKDDLLAPSGDFLNNREGDEPYDYPWTNENAPASTVYLSNPDGNPGSAGNYATDGGEGDDRWLASTTPDFSGSDPVWPHLTNLSGIYLRIPSPANTAPSVPSEYAVDNNPAATGVDAELRSDTADADEDGTPEVVITGPNDDRALDYGYDPDPASGLDGQPWLPLGADADGDGIVDSRWTWAPIRQIGGTKYVMAVRIVDNSSMVNVNTALSQVNDSRDYGTTATAAPQWWYPSELDLGSYVYDHAGRLPATPYTVFMDELEQLLEYRYDANGGVNIDLANPLPWDGAIDARKRYWEEAARLYDNYPVTPTTEFPRLGAVDEIALRYRNGLNDQQQTARLESDTQGMRAFMRQNNSANPAQFTDEFTYEDAVENLGFALNSDPAVNMENYNLGEPRHQMTTRSGATVLAPRLPDLATLPSHNGDPLTNDPPLVQKIDLNKIGTDRLSEEIRRVYEQDPANPTMALPGGGSSNVEADREVFANQLAANIRDYADADSLLGFVDPDDSTTAATPSFSGDETFGMEALPFLVEVYSERRYDATTTPNGSNFDAAFNQDGKPGYAIEIRNPLRRPISLENVYLWVMDPSDPSTAVPAMDPDKWGTLAELVNQSTMDPSGTQVENNLVLPPDQILVLYRNGGGDVKTNQIDMTSPRVVAAHLPETNANYDWPGDGDTTDGAFPVALRATAEGINGSMPFAYQRVDNAEAMPDTYTVTAEPPGPNNPPNTMQYKQVSSIGNTDQLAAGGDSLNMITIGPTEFFRKTVPVFGPYVLAHGELGQVSKPSSVPGDITNVDQNQLLISDLGKITHLGELAHVAVIGPDASTTVPEVWDGVGATSMEPFLLNFRTPNLMTANPDIERNLAVPHAVFLQERFTTIFPGLDGEDNNGVDGADEIAGGVYREQFVPGTINLNTVSGDLARVANGTHLLQSILPIALSGTGTEARDAAIRAIINYRDAKTGGDFNPAPGTDDDRGWSTAMPDYRDEDAKGIAYLSELMNAVSANAATGRLDILADPASANYSGDTSSIDTTPIDFKVDSGGSLVADADGIADDREEAAMIVKWLSQVASVRSDVYTAYVLIRGYPAGDFTRGPVEQKRFFLVLDRSKITNANGEVDVLASYEY